MARFLFATQPEDVIAAAEPALEAANSTFYGMVENVLDAAATAGFMAPLPLGVGRSVVMGAAQEYCRQWTGGTAAIDPADLVDVYQHVAVAAMRSTLEQEHLHA